MNWQLLKKLFIFITFIQCQSQKDSNPKPPDTVFDCSTICGTAHVRLAQKTFRRQTRQLILYQRQ
jgi:hypothetical protein